jgi:hypothetical protein
MHACMDQFDHRGKVSVTLRHSLGRVCGAVTNADHRAARSAFWCFRHIAAAATAPFVVFFHSIPPRCISFCCHDQQQPKTWRGGSNSPVIACRMTGQHCVCRRCSRCFWRRCCHLPLALGSNSIRQMGGGGGGGGFRVDAFFRVGGPGERRARGLRLREMIARCFFAFRSIESNLWQKTPEKGPVWFKSRRWRQQWRFQIGPAKKGG